MSKENQDQKDTLNLVMQASDFELVSQLVTLRKNLNTTILKELLKRWSESSNNEFRSKVYKIFADIKEQEALPFILDAIEQENVTERKNELISILWMSSVDASEQMGDLVNVAIAGDYMTVVEVSTVIESFDSEFGEDEVMEAMYQIDEKLLEIDNSEIATMLINLKEVINKLNVS